MLISRRLAVPGKKVVSKQTYGKQSLTFLTHPDYQSRGMITLLMYSFFLPLHLDGNRFLDHRRERPWRRT